MLVILLLVATAISAGLWAYERDAALPYEAMAIFAVVLLNATMGYIQESRAEAAVAALRAMSAADATVDPRTASAERIPAADIVPGDIVLIEEGDTIPADGRLIESAALQTAEAALTGESLPVTKDPAPIAGEVPLGDRVNMVFSGTAATYGHGKAVVTATGMQTEMGRIAGLLKATPDEPTPLQRELDRTGKMLGAVVIAIAVVMIVTIVVVEDVRSAAGLFDVLILGVALAVAAVPEGLPAVVTAVLSMGVQRMAKRNAIVRHLAAVETLGSASVIASDKTGTLTKNEMTVRVVVTASGRVTFEGSGYEPSGDVRSDGGGAGRRRAARRTRARAGRRRSRQQRDHSGARRAMDGAGRSDRRRAAGRGAKGGPRSRRPRRAFAARRRGAVLVGEEADEHAPPRRRAARSRHRLHQGSAGRAAGALLARSRRRGAATADPGAAARRSWRRTKRSRDRPCARSVWRAAGSPRTRWPSTWRIRTNGSSRISSSPASSA